ncbi:OTU domain-containing protein 5, partial [Toxocara canis]
EKNRDHFSQYSSEDFSEYLARKRRENEHGNHVELQAISEIFSRPIEIYEYCTDTADSGDALEAGAPRNMSFYEELIASSASGMSEWATAAETDADEKALLAQVMALSQQEFLDSLKRHSKEGRDGVGDGSEKAGSSKSSS